MFGPKHLALYALIIVVILAIGYAMTRRNRG